MKSRVAVVLLILASVLTPLSNLATAQELSESARKTVSRVNPQYPNLARTMAIRGNVRADVLVGPDGKPKSIEFTGGHPLLVQSSQDALKQWKWEPRTHETHEIIELRFNP